ncbi:hypothetical protein EYF80_057121 [Liparis tanakae]|uniref:Uncharacterized protein n=1 Tax=Liparis tanakae TaxID=230148 RepID=A0A4Z2EUV1_9TELE|nr:hypothetical protein EYF80_057121 [Liparis tanakae]
MSDTFWPAATAPGRRNTPNPTTRIFLLVSSLRKCLMRLKAIGNILGAAAETRDQDHEEEEEEEKTKKKKKLHL